MPKTIERTMNRRLVCLPIEKILLRRASQLALVAALAGLLPLLAGCNALTGGMWGDKSLDVYCVPAEAEVRVFQSNGCQDVLVEYTENHGGRFIPRAYYVLQDGDRVDTEGKRPQFVSLSTASDAGMQPLPSDGGTRVDPDSPGANPWSARISPDHSYFTLMSNETYVVTFDLPRYYEKAVAKKLLLTPAAVIVNSRVESGNDDPAKADSNTPPPKSDKPAHTH